MFDETNACWLWPADQSEAVNQYVEFRQEFVVESPSRDAKLAISAHANFAAWVNGQFVGTGQFTDYPDSKTFSVLEIGQSVRPGRNVLTVLANNFGETHFSYINDRGGLIFLLKCGQEEFVSGGDTLMRSSPAYRQGRTSRLTPQMGFTFEYDASKDDGWRDADYVADASWAKPTQADMQTLQQRPAPTLRPLAMLEIKPRPVIRPVAQGLFKREGGDDKTVAELMQSDFLSARRDREVFLGVVPDQDLAGQSLAIDPAVSKDSGIYVVVDLGREEGGFIDLELEAPAGAVVDIAVGEHLEDLRVRAAIGGRNFASRYVTAEGRQRFTHYGNRYAGRYLQLHISPSDGEVILHYAGLLPAEYPIQFRGNYNSPDNLQNRIYDLARRTMHLCMHEHYEDCPWREQALYANDGRNQALAGYYGFGEYDFPRVSLDLLGRGMKAAGYLEMCAPAEIPFTIPSFTMTWLLAMEDHLLFSGDVDLTRQYQVQVKQMLDGYLATLQDGLLPSPTGELFWHFYDWADGLCGTDVHPEDGGLTGTRFDAPMNLFFVLALRAGAKMMSACGDEQTAQAYRRAADEISDAVAEKFWVEQAGAYQTFMGDQAIEEHFAELTQALVLLAGACEPQRAEALRNRLTQADNGLVETTLSQSLYKFEAVLQDTQLGPWVLEKIAADWGNMLFAGATSFWETLKGQRDFDYAGSLCHGWSATPVYFYQAYLLGVKPLKPGFAEFSVDPLISSLPCASGTIPTPHGPIEVSWQKAGEQLRGKLTHPAGTLPILTAPDRWEVSQSCQ